MVKEPRSGYSLACCIMLRSTLRLFAQRLSDDKSHQQHGGVRLLAPGDQDCEYRIAGQNSMWHVTVRWDWKLVFSLSQDFHRSTHHALSRSMSPALHHFVDAIAVSFPWYSSLRFRPSARGGEQH